MVIVSYVSSHCSFAHVSGAIYLCSLVHQLPNIHCNYLFDHIVLQHGSIAICEETSEIKNH